MPKKKINQDVSAIPHLIIEDNKYCQLLTSDTALFNSIKKFLSFKIAGVEYTAAYKNGWNGITYLIDSKGYFLLGLLDDVKTYFDNKNITYTIADNRKPITINNSLDIYDRLDELKKTPYDHQKRILDAALNSNKGIIRSCTGSGKTLAAAMVAAKINKPTNIYVIGLDLLQQFHDVFSSIFDEPIGFIGDGVCKVERINIISIWTLGRILKMDKKDIISDEDENSDEEDLDQDSASKVISALKKCKVHIFDESHVITTGTIKQIFNNIDPEHIYGFSGTPFRDDNTDLLIKGILGNQIINVSASELIEKGLLAQPIIKFIPIPSVSMPLAQYTTVYKSYIVDNAVRNNIIAKNVNDLLQKKYTPLVLFKQIRHGEIIKELLEGYNIKCEMLYGNDSLERRTEVKKMLEEKEIDVILASTIFDIGVDIPMLNALVLCGSGKSSIRALQRIGRVIRAFPGKKFAAIVDFYDQTKFLKKHSQIRSDVYSSENGFKIIKCREMK